MKKYYFVLLIFLLSACSATPTPNPVEISLTMIADKVKAEATQGAVNSIFTATAQVAAATYTAQAIGTQEAVTQQARVDAQATSVQARADAQATQQRLDTDARATQQRIDADATQAQARRDAQATSDQARLDLSATQEAEAIAREMAITQAVQPTHDLWTQQAVEQAIIIGTNEVELSNLSVQQQRQTNTVEWVVPFLIALLLAAAIVLFIVRWSRAREFRNEDGDIEVVVFDGNQVVKPALLAKPMLLLGTNSMPDMVSPGEQARVTERAQAIKALAVMPQQTTTNATGAFNKYFGEPKENPYEIIDGDVLPPTGLIDSEALKSIENDWKEAQVG